MLPKPEIDEFLTNGKPEGASPNDQMRFDSELIEAIGNPVYLKDREGRFICVNRAWEQFYGIKREDAIGKRLHDVFPSVAADAHAAHDAALFSGSGPRVYELTVRGGDGEMHDTVHYKSVFSRADGSLPVDYLKIDGSFIRNICRDSIDLAMVESINHIGHIMGKQTIAEFVEDDATIALLRKKGVDCAQGYGIGAPKPMRVGKYVPGASDSLNH